MVNDSPPKFDRVETRTELGLGLDTWIVTLAPGSRSSEIERTLPLMLAAAKRHQLKYPDTRYVLPVAGQHLTGMINRILESADVDVMISQLEASRIMAASDSGLICSGTATLQALALILRG